MEDTKNIRILLFYKFEPISDPESFMREHKEFCNSLDILGKVLVAPEGINGSVSGSREDTEKYKAYLKSLPGFSDIVFKEEWGVSHPFTRMIVKVKREIVALKQGDIDPSLAGLIR